MRNQHLYEFDEFRLDPRRRLLWRAGTVIPLTNKAFETLQLLVERHGEVVEKNELMDKIWPDTFVEEGSLTRNISVLRKVLGEGPTDHQFIETVPRRGYRFVAAVQEVQPTGTEAEAPMFVAHDELELVSEWDSDSQSLVPEPQSLEKAQSSVLSPQSSEKTQSAVRSPQSSKKAQFAVRSPQFLVLLSLVGLTILTGAWTLGRFFFKPEAKKQLLQNFTVSRLTATGRTLDAAVSPDGKLLVFVLENGGEQSLWVKHIATAGEVQVQPPAPVIYQGVAVSPDGNHIYYNVWDKVGVGEIFRVPVLGGVPVRVVHDVMPTVVVSPDGRRVAFIRGLSTERANALMTADAAGGNEQTVVVKTNPDFLSRPVWSPDGTRLAFVTGKIGLEGMRQLQLVEISATGGPERPISPHRWLDVSGLTWMADGSGLLVTGAEEPFTPPQIQLVSYPGGEVRKITNEVNGYDNLTSSTDTKVFTAIQSEALFNIWVLPATSPNSTPRQTPGAPATASNLVFGKNLSVPTKVTTGRADGFSFCWTKDGRLIYANQQQGAVDLCLLNADGTGKKRLMETKAVNFNPLISADGHSVLFQSNRTGTFHIWRMDLDGGNQTQLTFGKGEWGTATSPQENWFVFIGDDGLYRLPVTGGTPELLLQGYYYQPAIAPDGDRIAYSYWDQNDPTPQWKRAIYSLSQRKQMQSFTLPKSAVWTSGDTLLRWHPNGTALTFINNEQGVSNIWELPLDGQPPRKLTDFIDNQIFWFDWSPLTGQLACTRGLYTSDVVLIHNTQVKD
ncbi:MAG: winged helix-turn-helix domain-containing protein [Blastocatellia bacterium]|nr:winged helix-turn-helix domain-containing protein [Blastocatellia bacterium]